MGGGIGGVAGEDKNFSWASVLPPLGSPLNSLIQA